MLSKPLHLTNFLGPALNKIILLFITNKILKPVYWITATLTQWSTKTHEENVIEGIASVTGTSHYELHSVSPLILSLAFVLKFHTKNKDGWLCNCFIHRSLLWNSMLELLLCWPNYYTALHVELLHKFKLNTKNWSTIL